MTNPEQNLFPVDTSFSSADFATATLVAPNSLETGFVPDSSRLPSTTENNTDVAWHTKARRAIGRAGLAFSVFTGGAAVDILASTPAHADTTWGVYQVQNTDGEGLILHDGSPSGSTIEVMPDGTSLQVQCYEIGPTIETSAGADPDWLQVVAPDGQVGEASDAYISTSWSASNTLADQGLGECGSDSDGNNSGGGNTNPQSAETVPVFTALDRNAAAQWALNHATLTPPNNGSCTWFVSNALWAGGMPQTSEWNGSWDDPHGLPEIVGGSGIREGTIDAWGAPNLVEYLSTMPYTTIEPLGTMSANNNDIPDAKLGDIIAYIWTPPEGIASMPLSQQLTYIDHLDMVTGASSTDPQYPLVSGWSENGGSKVDYQSRGWTWSAEHNEWLQDEPGQGNMVAYLIHINSEDDINISN